MLGVFYANQISMCLEPHLNSTSELRVRLARCKTRFSPPVKYYVFFCLAFAMPLCASVYMCLVITCWERKGLTSWLSFVESNCECHFPFGILCQVWYLIVSIPDLCILTYFLIH